MQTENSKPYELNDRPNNSPNVPPSQSHLSSISPPRGFCGGSFVVWRDGLPEPAYCEPISPQAIKQLHFAAMTLEYQGYYDDFWGEQTIEDRFKGCSNAEVIVRRQVEKAAEGYDKAAEAVLDRTIGKPKQSIESMNVQVSFQDFLDQVARDDFSTPSSQSSKSSQHPTINIDPLTHSQNYADDL